MKELIVIIDDERTFLHDNPEAKYVYLRTGLEAIGWLGLWWAGNRTVPTRYQEQGIDQLWFDYDLGGEVTGLGIAEFLKTLQDVEGDNPLPIYDIYVHSQNQVGADSIVKTLGGVPGNAFRVPLPLLQDLTEGQS